jgi:manganese/zinc/iron transport system permease protein
MDWLALLHDLLFDYTLRTVALGAASIGIVSGALGCFAVLRKQSLMGDAISHAALPGIVLAFLLTRSKEPVVLMLGAIAAGLVGTLLLIRIVGSTRIKYDSALGFVLSVFFGLGLMLLTYVQHLPDASQAGLDKFLFGQAATLLQRDVLTMLALGSIVFLLMAVFWKEFKLLSFDPQFGSSLGYPVRNLDILLTTLLVVSIVIGLQAVGVVLMSAMVIAPATAARQWTNRLGVMVFLAALFGAFSGVSGAVLSSVTPRLSTGPTIVLIICGVVLISLFFAPNRGLVWNWARHRRNRRALRQESVLLDLYTLASQHEDIRHPHTASALQAMSGGQADVRRSLQSLAARGLVSAESMGWSITPAGAAEAQQILANQAASPGSESISQAMDEGGKL